MTLLRIDVWSDIACPWCYVGKRRLEQALSNFAHASQVRVVWRAFELDPKAPRQNNDGTYIERLARKYQTTTGQAEAMISRMVDAAKLDGLNLDFSIIRSGNTFDAHRLLHFAKLDGLQTQLKEALFSGYFTRGEAIGDVDALQRMAVESGLDGQRVNQVLNSDEYAVEVRADEAEAKELGIRGVPFFVLGGRYAVSGAQPAELILEALEKASQAAETQVSDYAEGSHCGPDGC